MRVMPGMCSKGKAKQNASSSAKWTLSKNRRKKRKLSCSSVEDLMANNGNKRRKRDAFNNGCTYESLRNTSPKNSESEPNDRLVVEEKLIWNKKKSSASRFRKNPEKDTHKHSSALRRSVSNETCLSQQSKCWINDLPQEILLKILSYLPLGMLLRTVPQVCKKWEILAMDWTLWKTVEDLTIKNMVISTAMLRTLLRTIPKLKKLELILRNDTEELLHELFKNHQNLEVLKLDRCYHTTPKMNILSQTVTSILDISPKLKTVMLTDTYFHNKDFYRCLARKFKAIERINVTCTTKSEMDVFMKNLRESVPEGEFQKVPMMGRAEGKQIYWGPILGLVVRPTPTSPFHQQYIHDDYPNYVF